MEVHRLRIGNYLPKAIKFIAVDHIYSQKVAIGREDGDIEILDPKSNFSVQARITGSQDFKLQGLQWSVHDEEVRLFGISLKGFLFEVDLERLSIMNVEDVYGGAAWCLAVSPREPLLAVGGEKGLIRLFRYHSLNRVDYERSIATSSSRILSVAYHPSQARIFVGGNDGVIRCIDERSEQTLFRMTGDVAPKSVACVWSLAVSDDSTVMSGDSAGLVQVWDGQSGVLQQTFPNHHVGDVLALAVTSDGTSFFTAGVDGKVNSFRRSAATSSTEVHTATPLTSQSQLWHFSESHRLHSHDVFSLAICSKASTPVKTAAMTSEAKRRRSENDSEEVLEVVTGEEEDEVEGGSGNDSDVMSLLLSGGLDSKICVYSATRHFDSTSNTSFTPFFLPLVRNRHDEHVIGLTSHLTQTIGGSNTSSSTSEDSSSSVTCVMKRHDCVDVWRIHLIGRDCESERGSGSDRDDVDNEEVSRRCELVLRLQQKRLGGEDASDVDRDHHLSVALTSASGRFLFMAGKGMVRLLAVSGHVIEEVALPALLTTPPRHVTAACFDYNESDVTYLTVWDASQRHLLRLRIHTSSKEVEVVHDVALGQGIDEGLGAGRSPADRKLGKQVKRVHVSEASKYVLVLTCADVIHIFQADKMIRRWTLPTSSVVVADVSFFCERFVFVLLTDGRLLTYDIQALQLLGDFDLEGLEVTSLSCLTTRRSSTMQHREISTYAGLSLAPLSSSEVVVVCYSAMHCLVLRVTLTSETVIVSESKASHSKKRKAVTSSLSEGVKVEVEAVQHNDRYRNVLAMTWLPHLSNPSNTNTSSRSMKKDLTSSKLLSSLSLVVVENPWTNLHEQLPDVVQRKRYGT